MWARLKMAQGQSEAAQQLLAKTAGGQGAAIQLASARAEAERIRLHLLLNQLQPDTMGLHTTVQAWIAARHLAVGDDLPYAREFEYAMLARALIALGTLETAHILLQRLVSLAERGQRPGDLIEYLALDALALHAQGQARHALTTLRSALLLAEPAGYVRVFVDEGQPMRALLHDLRRGLLQLPAPDKRPSLAYVDRLLDAFAPSVSETTNLPSANPTTPSRTLLEPLTARELEVLPLLAQGLTNQEIAERLVISPGTAKRHIANIFAKLDVANRTQAINRAREERLL